MTVLEPNEIPTGIRIPVSGVGAPPAIANAVMDALAHPGVTHMEIPIRPDHLLEVLREKGVAGSRGQWRMGR